MTLEDIFYVSQSIASVAVVGSLIYVGLQVRQAERSQRGLMQQARADRTSTNSITVADPVLSRIWLKGMAGDADLTAVEFTQWMLICRSAFLSGEDSILQYKAGLLSKETYDTYVAGVRHFMATPGFRAGWKLSRMQFGPEFRDFTDSILNEIAPATSVDALSEWNALVLAEKAAVSA
ncbi:MAG: hypothetical protein ABSD74_02355 [Rhizomicrobium sp.]|jgi:hypothetical protein